jgi:hypothetical protein
MRNGIIPLAIGVFSIQLALAKDFKKSYSIPPASQVTIENFLGSIKVTGCKVREVTLTATMKSPEGDSITISDERFGDGIRIFSRDSQFIPPKEFGPLRGPSQPMGPGPLGGPGQPMSPGSLRGPGQPMSPGSLRGPGQPMSPGAPMGPGPFRGPGAPPQFVASNAKVDFDICMPQTIEYKSIRISTLSGEVKVSKVKGRFWITSQRGDVEVKEVSGWVTASSTSGNVNVFLERTKERSSMNFSSISGNVEVVAPSNLDASVDMRSLGGVLKTDFPIEIKDYRYMGKFALGKLGTGIQNLSISSNSGRVNLLRK